MADAALCATLTASRITDRLGASFVLQRESATTLLDAFVKRLSQSWLEDMEAKRRAIFFKKEIKVDIKATALFAN